MDNFNDYLNEYMSMGVGSLIYDFIHKVVTPLASHYPPAIYSPNGVWDEDALSAICNDFIFDKLLSKGWLDLYFLTLDSTNGLKMTLKRDFRHYLSGRKARTEKNNLYMRVSKILNGNPKIFQPYSKSDTSGGLWGLTGWTVKEIDQDSQSVTAVISTIQIPRLIRYRLDSAKVSHLLSNPDLTRLVEEIFTTLDKQVSFSVLFDAICNRLGAITDEVVSFNDRVNDENDQTLEDITPDFSVFVEIAVSAKQIAENIFEQLSDRQRDVFWLQFSSDVPNLVKIGEHLGISKSTVSNELNIIGMIIKDNKIDTSDIDPVIQNLKELLSTNQVTNKSN